jgi:hypothetical protein
MKKFYKSLIPFFGASLFKNQLPSLAKNITEPKEIFIGTKLEKTDYVQDQAKLAFEKEKNTLNKKKVFLLVKNTDNKEKGEENILLLLGSLDRLNTSRANYQARQKFLFTKTEHIIDKKTKAYVESEEDYMSFKDQFTNVLNAMRRGFDVEQVLNAREKTFLKFGLRGGKSYFVISEGGYKSICPVFFDETSAKNFLMENIGKTFEDQIRREDMEDNIKVKKNQFNLPFTSSKKTNRRYKLPRLSKKIENIKIICLGLGDFIEYYSTVPNKEALEKVEFFFIPKLDSINSKMKIPCLSVKGNKRGLIVKTDQRKFKGFKSYQRQLYETKRQTNQEQ